jgi:hypothetical protein
MKSQSVFELGLLLRGREALQEAEIFHHGMTGTEFQAVVTQITHFSVGEPSRHEDSEEFDHLT